MGDEDQMQEDQQQEPGSPEPQVSDSGAGEGAAQEGGGKKAGTGLVVVGYIFAVLGGLIGLIIGAIVAFGKDKTSDGTKYNRYDERSRKQGKIIFFIAIGMIVFWNIIARVV
jgi:hypothetical protein